MKLRTQLTLVYAVPFLISGAALLSIPVLQSRQTAPVAPGFEPGPGAPPGLLMDRILAASAIGLVVMAGLALLLGWLVAGRFLGPLRTITATAREISASNLHRRLGGTGRRNEFGELAATLDDLFARLEAAFLAQRHFVANASHELRTPLTAERTLLQVALADPAASVESLRAACEEVLELGAAQERLIGALLSLASGEQGVEATETVDLAALTERVLASRPTALRIERALAVAPVRGDPRLLESLIANLVDNALRHNVPGGTVEIQTGPRSFTVRNTGPVIEPAAVQRLFEPFQRLGPQRVGHDGGHGLGLAIVRAIARAHGASIDALPRSGGGLEITVRLP